MHKLKATQGKLWVKAHYKGNEDTTLVDSEEWLSTCVFEEGEVPGSAHCFIERTIQVKQFEPLKISIGCSVPCRKEEKEAAIEECVSTVKNRFIGAMKEVTSELRKLGR